MNDNNIHYFYYRGWHWAYTDWQKEELKKLGIDIKDYIKYNVDEQIRYKSNKKEGN